jgi:hypothetical protein
MDRRYTLRAFVALAALCGLMAGPLLADNFDDHRKRVERELPGGYIHGRIFGQGGCSISPIKDRPGHFLFQGEGESGKSIFRLSDDSPYHLIKVEGSAHPGSCTVIFTKSGIEIFWRCRENDVWHSPR